MSLQRFCIWFLLLEAAGAATWWCLLLAQPSCRRWFMANGAPDVTLLAFGGPDVVLFVATAAASAFGFLHRRPWAWPVLCVHAGAAGYAALYCWMLVALTGGDGIAGALLMTPSLVVPGVLAWRLRPKDGEAC